MREPPTGESPKPAEDRGVLSRPPRKPHRRWAGDPPQPRSSTLGRPAHRNSERAPRSRASCRDKACPSEITEGPSSRSVPHPTPDLPWLEPAATPREHTPVPKPCHDPTPMKPGPASSTPAGKTGLVLGDPGTGKRAAPAIRSSRVPVKPAGAVSNPCRTGPASPQDKAQGTSWVKPLADGTCLRSVGA